jgi:site-specific DNA recombinase
VRVAIYARCSTLEQVDSPDVQLVACREWAEKNGHSVVAEYIDAGVSGGKILAERPQAALMLASAKSAGVEAILALRQDRLGRDDLDLGLFRREAQKRKLELLFVTQQFASDPYGDFMWSIFAAQGQLERRITGLRIKEHAVWLAKQGRKPGGYAALGLTYRCEQKDLVVDPVKSQHALRVFELFVANSGNWRKTCIDLVREGISSPRGRVWTICSIQQIIRNPIYRGAFRYGGEEYESDAIPLFLPQSLVAQAQALAKTVNGSKGKSGNTHAYTSILTCGMCGKRMLARPSKNINGDPHVRYICNTRAQSHTCENVGIGEKRLEQYMIPVITDVLRRHMAEIMDNTDTPPVISYDVQSSLKDKRQRWEEMYATGIITLDRLKNEVASIDAELANLPKKKQSAVAVTAEQVREYLEHLTENWQSVACEAKRGFMLMVCPQVELMWDDRWLTLVLRTPLAPEPVVVKHKTERGKWRGRKG